MVLSAASPDYWSSRSRTSRRTARQRAGVTRTCGTEVEHVSSGGGGWGVGVWVGGGGGGGGGFLACGTSPGDLERTLLSAVDPRRRGQELELLAVGRSLL